MPYSLVSAATLGFDLVRLPAGRSVADVLLDRPGRRRAGSLPCAGRRPPGPRPGPGRAAACSPSAPARPASWPPPCRTCATPPPGSQPGDRAAVLVAQLERGTIGDAPTLERLAPRRRAGPGARSPRGFLHDDELAEAAADVLADAALGHWAAGVLPPLVRRELTGPFDRCPGAAARRRPTSVRPPPSCAELLDAAARPRRRRPGRAGGAAVDEGRGRPPPVGRRDARGLLGRPRLRAAPARWPPPSCTPSRRSSTRASTVARRRRRRVERPRRLRAGHRDGRPARRRLHRRPARPARPSRRTALAPRPPTFALTGSPEIREATSLVRALARQATVGVGA